MGAEAAELSTRWGSSIIEQCLELTPSYGDLNDYKETGIVLHVPIELPLLSGMRA